jgi:uncharacterized protein (DUF488 family)
MEITPEIWTIGHSTRSLDAFMNLLEEFRIGALADVRTYPGSRRYPHFNSEPLARSLAEAGIEYLHIPELGGRRKPSPNAPSEWRNAAFRGYAEYMSGPGFSAGIARLTEAAALRRTAYMCSEAVWWRCHRALISDFLKTAGWRVLHILDKGKAEEHPYTQPAKVMQGKLFY